MDDRMGKVPQIPFPVLFPHFEGVENMDLRARDIDVAGQRSDEIGIELILQLCWVI